MVKFFVCFLSVFDHNLVVQLHTLSEKVSASREAKDGVDANLPQVATIYRDSPKLETIKPPEVKLPKDRKIDSLCSSPIVFSNKLKSLYGRELCHDNSSGSVENSQVAKTEPQTNRTKASNHEWVEQYEPGIYITFTTLASGQKGLKRVRFR